MFILPKKKEKKNRNDHVKLTRKLGLLRHMRESGTFALIIEDKLQVN